MVLPILAAVAGGLIASSGSRSAANTQAQAAQDASDAQLTATRETNEMLERFHDDSIERFDPYYQGGLNAFDAILFENGLGPRPEGYEGFTATPGYDFRLQSGIDAVQSNAAARGSLNSGAAAKALERFGQDYASSEYGNYLARLGSLASSGQNAAGMQGAASQNYGTQMGNNMMAGGQAQAQGFLNAGNAAAQGTIGATNAFTGAIGNAVGAWQYNNMLNAFAR